MRDLYAVLDVAPGASREAIAQAYRQLARASHPDARPDDPEAAARFRVVTNAYEVLSDPVRRAHYDRARRANRSTNLAQSGGSRPGQDRLATVHEPRVGRRDTADVFLDASPPRSLGVPLWAGPVRLEASPSETLAEVPRPQASPRRELDRLTSLLLGLLTHGWPE